MNQIWRIAVVGALLLSACVSTLDPGIGVVDNTQIEQQFTDCNQIANSLSSAEKIVENLRSQRKISNLGNGVNTASAILNPFILLNAQWSSTKKIDEVLASYEERVKKLTERKNALNCSATVMAASAPVGQ